MTPWTTPTRIVNLKRLTVAPDPELGNPRSRAALYREVILDPSRRSFANRRASRVTSKVPPEQASRGRERGADGSPGRNRAGHDCLDQQNQEIRPCPWKNA